MGSSKRNDFGVEMAKILPLLIREFGRRQKIFFEGKFPMTYLVVLDMLREMGPVKMSVIARMMNITMSTATAIIDKMIDDKLVKRDRSSSDRRVVNVTMTKKGIEMATQIVEWRIDMSNDMFAVLSGPERDEYLRLLTKVRDSILEEKNENKH